MRNLIRYFIFALVAITILFFVMWLKHISFQKQWFGVSTDTLGLDGLAVWFCLMMAIRPALNKLKL